MIFTPSSPRDPALPRRVEEASLNAWPAPRQVLLDGWVLRFADGYTRRANSATPLDAGMAGPAALSSQIAQCEALYAAQRLPALIRVRSFDDAKLAAALTARGYTAEGLSPVLWMPLASSVGGGPGSEDVELSEAGPGPGWLECQARLSGCDVSARARILDAVAVPCAFAGARADGPGSPLVSVAFGAVHGGVVCLHLVATDPAFRRRGLSRLVVTALLAWARDRAHAREASLQVAAENAGALALYGGIGFRTELFRYQYYRQPRGVDTQSAKRIPDSANRISAPVPMNRPACRRGHRAHCRGDRTLRHVREARPRRPVVRSVAAPADMVFWPERRGGGLPIVAPRVFRHPD